MELALPVDAPQVTTKRLSFFERYLTLWVALCMVIGVLIGQAMPGLVSSLRGAEIGQGSHINLPIAVLIWLMIWPMMMKVDFASIKHVGRNPKGLYVTWAANFIELSVAVAISLFGAASPVVLATIVGVLVEVPVMLHLVKIANRTTRWFPSKNQKSAE